MSFINEEQAKNILLNILKDIDFFCSEYGIRYYLAYGTLLGAIRHNGFIPWDDDIDIMMPRGDYERFIKIYNRRSNYKVYSCANTPEYYYEFSKVVDTRTYIQERSIRDINNMGLYVDVFPLDYVPSLFTRYSLFFLEKIRALSVYKKCPVVRRGIRPLVYAVWLLLRRISPVKLAILINKIAQKKLDGKQVSIIVSPDMVFKKLDLDIFKHYLYVKFEEGKYRAPIDYETYLKIMYKNWQQLPPIHKRISNHSYIAYLR